MIFDSKTLVDKIQKIISDSYIDANCKLCNVKTLASLFDIHSCTMPVSELPAVPKQVNLPPTTKPEKPKSDKHIKFEMPSIAADLLEYIESHDINLSDVAKTIGIEAGYLRSMLRGEKRLSNPTIDKIKGYLQQVRANRKPAVEKPEWKEFGEKPKTNSNAYLLGLLIEYRQLTRVPLHQIATGCGMTQDTLLTILEGRIPERGVDYSKVEAYLQKAKAI